MFLVEGILESNNLILAKFDGGLWESFFILMTVQHCRRSARVPSTFRLLLLLTTTSFIENSYFLSHLHLCLTLYMAGGGILTQRFEIFLALLNGTLMQLNLFLVYFSPMIEAIWNNFFSLENNIVFIFRLASLLRLTSIFWLLSFYKIVFIFEVVIIF